MKASKILTTSLVSLFLGTSALAASSGTLILQGTVGVVNDIVVTAAAGNANTTLDIVNGETGKLVGTATETSNNLLGYKIRVASATGGELRNTQDATKKTAYKIKYNGATTGVTPTVAGVEVKNVASLSGLTTVTSNIAVDVTAYPTAPAGTYADTLTVSIQAN